MKTRDTYYDNVKFLLIFLVVFGHLIQSFVQEDKLIYTLYTTIYTFHMPAFILISGFFAKGFQQKGYLMKISKKLILPYLIFQGIYSIYYYYINAQNTIALDPLNPQWSLWFLVSLFCWNVLLFLFTKWKAPLALLTSVTLGVLAGYFNDINSFLSLSRTFVFFPFFLLGFYLKKEHFEKFREAKFKYVSVIVFILVFVGLYLLPQLNYQWLFGSKPYAALTPEHLTGGIIRLGIYSLSLLLTLSFLTLVPKKRYFFSQWGTSSIYVYLLHGFFVKYFRNSELTEMLKETQHLPLLLILSLVLTILLSSSITKKFIRPLVEWGKFGDGSRISTPSK